MYLALIRSNNAFFTSSNLGLPLLPSYPVDDPFTWQSTINAADNLVWETPTSFSEATSFG